MMPLSARFQTTCRRSRGTILIVAMWIVLVLAGLALLLARSMRVELAASANSVAARIGKAAFLAPEIDTSPSRALPPTIASLSTADLGLRNTRHCERARDSSGVRV
jgi:hypothetical protein